MIATRTNDSLDLDFQTFDSRSEQWFLLTSDIHFDSVKCDRKLLKKHLDQMIEKDAYWLDFGDFFDLMQGRDDRRGNKSDLRPEYQRIDYINAVIEDAASFLEPYKHRLLHLTEGNHEADYKSRHEVDPLSMLIYALGTKVNRGKYTGWMRFKATASRYVSKIIYYTHGTGGDAPVTKGVIGTARRSDYIDADLLISGHIHTSFILPRQKLGLNQNGNVQKKDIDHVQLGTYKNSVGSYWEDKKGFPPPSMGGAWLRLWASCSHDTKTFHWDIFRAK